MSNTQDNNQPDLGPPDLEPEPKRPQRSELTINVNVDDSVTNSIDKQGLCKAAIAAAAERGFCTGEIGIRVTDDATIKELNAKHLSHDYPTDVISFGYECETPMVSGELVVSIDTAERRANEFSWPAQHELTLYVVHGVLHITGMDDQSPSDRAKMRSQERQVMLSLGVDDIDRCAADNEADRPHEASR